MREHDEREQGCARRGCKVQSYRTPPPRDVVVPPQAPIPCTRTCSYASPPPAAAVPIHAYRQTGNRTLPIVPAPVRIPYLYCTNLALYLHQPALFPPCPYPGLPPMASRLSDFRTSRVASRLSPRPDALRRPRSWACLGLGLGPGLCSGPHMHMLALRLACFPARAKFAARQSGELRGARSNRGPGQCLSQC